MLLRKNLLRKYYTARLLRNFGICMFLILLVNIPIMPVIAAEGTRLQLSAMQIRITSQRHTALFQLYATAAAKELHDQLPLKLQLSNFADVQWMFYPPQKLPVKADEAYHDGKKGELSYYAPWGDVFMLYKDFHAGDEMHRLGINLSGVDQIAKMSGDAVIEKNMQNSIKEKTSMKIKVIAKW